MTSKIVPNGGKPQIVTLDVDLSKSDVGDIAAAVAGCNTPHAAKVAPSARLVLLASAVSAKDTEKVQKALAHVKGVNAKHSEASKGQILIHVEKGAKLAEIREAIEKAGLVLK
ncbi:hypothetical protein HRbin36_00173 [bacterium HR36]|nr:hypothetical protein HRbin36_00173 [bacterium HR36]